MLCFVCQNSQFALAALLSAWSKEILPNEKNLRMKTVKLKNKKRQ